MQRGLRSLAHSELAVSQLVPVNTVVFVRETRDRDQDLVTGPCQCGADKQSRCRRRGIRLCVAGTQ